VWLKESPQPFPFSLEDWGEFIKSPEEYPLYFRNKIRFVLIKKRGKVHGLLAIKWVKSCRYSD